MSGEEKNRAPGFCAALDPRAKLMLLVCLSGPAVFISDIRFLAALFAASLCCAFLCRADFRKAAPFLKVTVGMLIPLFIVQCLFTRNGTPLLTIHGCEIVMWEGLEAGILMMLRILAVVTSALILTTSPSRDYLLALVQCRVPYELAFMIMTAMHFLPLLSAEARDMIGAVQMKGIDLKRIPLRKKASVYLSLMLPLLSRTLRRAEAMSCAMQMRGFRSRPQRTYMRRLTLKKKDKALLLICPLAAAAFLLWEKGLFG